MFLQKNWVRNIQYGMGERSSKYPPSGLKFLYYFSIYMILCIHLLTPSFHFYFIFTSFCYYSLLSVHHCLFVENSISLHCQEVRSSGSHAYLHVSCREPSRWFSPSTMDWCVAPFSVPKRGQQLITSIMKRGSRGSERERETERKKEREKRRVARRLFRFFFLSSSFSPLLSRRSVAFFGFFLFCQIFYWGPTFCNLTHLSLISPHPLNLHTILRSESGCGLLLQTCLVLPLVPISCSILPLIV